MQIKYLNKKNYVLRANYYLPFIINISNKFPLQLKCNKMQIVNNMVFVFENLFKQKSSMSLKYNEKIYTINVCKNCTNQNNHKTMYI